MNTLRKTRHKVNHKYASGFTLIEIVIVIAIVGIISASLAPIITQFMNAYEAEIRRGALTDQAQLVLDRIAREVRLALPNSIRVTGGTAIELLRTIDGGRFRSGSVDANDDPLLDNGSDNSFDVIGEIINCGAINAGGTFITMNNNPNDPASDAYEGQNIAPITACGPDADNISSHITFDETSLTGGVFFNFPSENNRFQVIDTPVSYLCANSEIRRYDGYDIVPVQPTTDLALTAIATANFSNDLLVNNVASCLFSINQNSVVTISVTIQSPASGENVTLMQQVSVANG